MTKNPYVRQFLDLSTAHIQETTANKLTGGYLNSSPTQYGWWIYVPEQEEQKEFWPDCPNDLSYILGKARELGCVYVNLDADALEMDGLKTYEW